MKEPTFRDVKDYVLRQVDAQIYSTRMKLAEQVKLKKPHTITAEFLKGMEFSRHFLELVYLDIEPGRNVIPENDHCVAKEPQG